MYILRSKVWRQLPPSGGNRQGPPRSSLQLDANENSEAQVSGLVKEFTTFHGCLKELGELMKQYGQPLRERSSVYYICGMH